MFSNYLKIALRNILRHKTYSAINIAGLATGIACCVLILLYVKDELTHDTFQTHAGSLYRVTLRETSQNEEETEWGITPPPLAPVLKSEISEIINSLRLFSGSSFVRQEGRVFKEDFLLTDQPFFQMFSFKLLRGDPATALRDPNSVVLTSVMAEKYFGNNDPVGKTLSFKLADRYRDLTVTGIAEQAPENSSIKFNALLPFELLREIRGEQYLTNWGNEAVNTFVLLREDASVQGMIPKLETIYKKHLPKTVTQKPMGLQALTDLHLNTKIRGKNGLTDSGDLSNSLILAAIALFILAIACINFMNLAIGQSTSRSREIGMRKVHGAYRIQLAQQFLGEAMLLSAFALFLGIVLAELFLPTFNTLAGKQLSINYGSDWMALFGSMLLMVLVGFFAGSYPALYLSRFQPVDVLRKNLRVGGPNLFSRSLIVLQFVLSVFLIIGTTVIQTQVDFMKTKSLGFDKEQVVIIPTHSEQGTALYERYKNELASHANILGVTGSEYSLGGSGSSGRSNAVIDGKEMTAWRFGIDYNYLETYGIQLAQGRTFSKQFGLDANESVLVNEAFVRQFGLEQPVGIKFQYNTPHMILGVVKDFNFLSQHDQIEPLVLHLTGNGPIEIISVRIKPTDISITLELLQTTWTKIAPDLPFKYSFLDEELGNLYRDEQRWARIVAYSSIFSVAIACFGVYGLTLLAVTRRTKEISIRKVLGASVPNILRLLSKEFTRLVLVANIVAWPIAYVVMNKWLQDFAYRIDIGWTIFALAGIMTLGITVITVSYIAIKAALSNPVESLRYE